MKNGMPSVFPRNFSPPGSDTAPPELRLNPCFQAATVNWDSPIHWLILQYIWWLMRHGRQLAEREENEGVEKDIKLKRDS